MPGIVVFRRRWSVGSDDLVVPGAFLFTVHFIWSIILTVLICLASFHNIAYCELQLLGLIIGYLIIMAISMALEVTICVVALRGSILNTGPRSSMQYFLYFRVAVMFLEGGWLSTGIAWLVKNYFECPLVNPMSPKETLLSMVVFHWSILLSVMVTVWCTYDSAGRSWVKMKQYQRSMREAEHKFQYKRSGSTRNWRQRKVLRAYQDSWHNRCRFLFCCSSTTDRNRNSFADIARLLSDFFRDLDVVPSDVIAGLVLLRKFQKIERAAVVERRQNDTYEYLSGVAVTPRTKFLSLHDTADLELMQTVIHYANYAVRAYGWPVYFMSSSSMGACKMCYELRCGCCLSPRDAQVVDDNCCRCNYATLEQLATLGAIEVIYATYHVDVGETPFFVALDYDRRKVVVSVRGTLSMKDILTDLNAESETLPLTPPRDDWLGHKGMVQAAQYIYDKLHEENLIERALRHNPAQNTPTFELVIVGHSLGAGTASILGILLRQTYPTLKCYCYSPPGGLLSMPAVEYTKQFTVSVVVGKDVVPRIGLHQMEALRADLINAIKRSVDPKWKILCGIVCGCSEPTSAVEMERGDCDVGEYTRSKKNARSGSLHPVDSTIALTSHPPLYPPGRIIHVVRHHPTRGEQKYEKRWRQALAKKEPVYQALWVENTDFDEVLISPVMIQDHMPDHVLDALNKVVTTLGPRKPQRTHLEEDNKRFLLETSFTSLQSPLEPQIIARVGSTVSSNGYYSTRSHATPTPDPVDLIHDDWFGLAPLASPESLSEVGSISSMVLTATPKVMRRTLKITGNLSGCADDVTALRQFEAAPVFRTPDSKSSSELSYESASSNNSKNLRSDCDFQSAEDVLDNVLTRAGCKEFFDSHSNFLEAHLDMFEEPHKSPEQDPDIISNMAVDLTLDESHRVFFQQAASSVTDSWSVSRSTPDATKNVTFNPQVINIITTNEDASSSDRWHLFKSKPRPRMMPPPAPFIANPPKTILSNKRHHHSDELTHKRRHHSDEGIFMTKSEAALNAMGGHGSSSVSDRDRTSPTLLQRKKYVYPMEIQTLKGSESSV